MEQYKMCRGRVDDRLVRSCPQRHLARRPPDTEVAVHLADEQAVVVIGGGALQPPVQPERLWPWWRDPGCSDQVVFPGRPSSLRCGSQNVGAHVLQ